MIISYIYIIILLFGFSTRLPRNSAMSPNFFIISLRAVSKVFSFVSTAEYRTYFYLSRITKNKEKTIRQSNGRFYKRIYSYIFKEIIFDIT